MLETKRLTLKLLVEGEADVVHTLFSFPEVDEYNTLGIPENIEKTVEIVFDLVKEHQINPIKKYTFSISDKLTSDFIGLVALNIGKASSGAAEVWYKLLPKSWGQGYATEALQEIISFGFNEIGLHRIEAGCAKGNLGSIRVLEKAGMTLEGRRRKALPLKSGWSDTCEFAILAED